MYGYVIDGLVALAALAVVLGTVLCVIASRKHKLWHRESQNLLKQWEQEDAKAAMQPMRGTKIGLGPLGVG
jgi:hypothetical protein